MKRIPLISLALISIAAGEHWVWKAFLVTRSWGPKGPEAGPTQALLDKVRLSGWL